MVPGGLKGWWDFQGTWKGLRRLRGGELPWARRKAGEGWCSAWRPRPRVFRDPQPCAGSSSAARCWHCLGSRPFSRSLIGWNWAVESPRHAAQREVESKNLSLRSSKGTQNALTWSTHGHGSGCAWGRSLRRGQRPGFGPLASPGGLWSPWLPWKSKVLCRYTRKAHSTHLSRAPQRHGVQEPAGARHGLWGAQPSLGPGGPDVGVQTLLYWVSGCSNH